MTFLLNLTRRNKKCIYFTIVVILVAALFFIVPACGAPKLILLKLAHGVNQDHPTNLVALEVRKEIALRTNNRIQLEIFGNMQLGEEAELAEMLQKGSLDLAIISTGPLFDYNRDLGVLDLPYLFKDRAQAYQAWDGAPGTAILKQFNNSGLEGICYWENGLRSVTTKNTPIMMPHDLRNIQIRTMENPIYVDFFSYLGALPTPMPWGQVTPSLQAGIIEAQENPISITVTYQLDNYQRYLILTRHVYNPHLVLYGSSLKKKLTAKELSLLSGIFYDFRIKQRQYVVEQETSGIKTLPKKEMILVEPDLAEFRKVGKEFSKSMITRFSKEIRIYFERYLE